MNRILLFLCLIVFGCNSVNNQKQKSSKSIAFDSFQKEFKQVQLPIVIKACEMNGSIPQIDGRKDQDSLFMELSGHVPLYKFKTNGNYIGLICLGLADCALPVLMTFDSNGNKIDEQAIAIGGCGVGPGFECHEYMTLRKDYTLYTSDTITVSAVDSLSNIIPGTEESYVNYKEGKLLSSGKIELSGEAKKDLKGK